MSNAPNATSSILSGATNNTFTNSTFVVQSNQNAAFDRLHKAASPSAFHSYVGRPEPGKCYPNTRVNLLKKLEKWAQGVEPQEETTNSDLGTDSRAKAVTDHDTRSGGESDQDQDTDTAEKTESDQETDSREKSESNQDTDLRGKGDLELDIYTGDKTPGVLHNLPIVWLKGGAGAGKSAVAQTFAERCEDLGHIVASFFFFSTDPTRNNANRLVATLAYQIALADPRIRSDMETIIHHDPHIFDKDFTKQFTSLIVNPIQKSLQIAPAEENPRPCTVIIDGLDECTGGKVQAGIVRAISGCLRTEGSTAPSAFPRFLICSRSEEPIMRVFRSARLTGIYTSIDLSTNTTVDKDLDIFLEEEFTDLKETHPHANRIPDDWPSHDDLWTLRRNSSGHFIYADTVMKFVSADVRPVVALGSILGLRVSPQKVREPFAELDELYHHILSRALEHIDIDTIRIAFGFLAMENCSASDFHSNVLEKFLDLQDGDLDILFNITSSLVSVQWSRQRDRIKFCHKSFSDFLHDKRRSGKFYIDDDSIYMHAATRCHAMVADAATLGQEIYSLMVEFEIRCSRAYDYHDGKRCYSSEGMTRRREVSAFLHQALAGQGGHPEWVVRCLEYYCSLLNTFGKSQGDTNLIQQAKEDMVAIMLDLLQHGYGVRGIRVTFQEFDTHRLALLLCQPVKFIKDAFQWPWSIHVFATGSFGSELVKGFIGDTIRKRSQEDLFVVGELLEADSMADHCLTPEKYAAACLYWATKLTKRNVYFPRQPLPVLQNQRCIMTREPARRLRAPFQWRKTRQIIRPYNSKGRLGFLYSQQRFEIAWDTTLEPALTNRQLFFGSRPALVRQVRRQCNSTKDEIYVRREHCDAGLGPKKAITWHDQRTTARGYSRLDRQAIRGRSFVTFDLQIFDPLEDDPSRERGFHLLPLRRREFSKVHENYSYKALGGSKEQQRGKEYSLLLSRIPTMLAKASKSDDLAALRFKAFPPFARQFPKLMRRARQAMEGYAVRHGYPAIEGTFGPPMQHSVNHAPDADHVTNTGFASRTCFLVMEIWLKYLCLRLGALLGGLDEIYNLG